ncbi:uncharacterized protein LAESUDRAFT_478191 [Laetiporus sulphureus 93-53]|uniref:Bromo domain-containing protein n=1 Tax=Laetiporus sulphureus 93-53 TaxID=1314785 RepID=A0A165BQJ7_9APHY|nr:uncharacterized protein LAESUDRAFT_478191 [Laetiporus sulphureus 93-53]KZT01472.1 hypothetical protein LAESUDRAFT_478191 [Laetiporus sulphureus 93-53]
MNNLLRTLTSSQVKAVQSHTDLKLLLSAVKESRRQSHDAAKLSDAFYDSLEGLLHDLRMVTMDNRDAEAFLKPVSKTDVPDYYDVIANPMDLQTMLRKVKQKQYKSKKEFKDDLDLIWSNCFMYNATENHPLRMCATRLKAKAEKLLQNITDWKERADPAIPADISLPGPSPKTNGMSMNGFGRYHSPTVMKSPSPGKAVPIPPGAKRVNRDVSFPESPAIVRTPRDMVTFAQLDRRLDELLNAPATAEEVKAEQDSLKEQLLEYIVAPADDQEGTQDIFLDGDVGMKRKLNGTLDSGPRKRMRMHSPSERHLVELWWDAVQSEQLLGNGLPVLAYPSSERPISSTHANAIDDPPREGQSIPLRKKRKAGRTKNTLLHHINNNIRTLRRVRTTHAKFAALSQSNEDGAAPAMPAELPSDDVEDVLDERPWRPTGTGIEVGAENADDCLHWMDSKVLEHAGFQGTSKVALDVLASVTSEYLLNVGRTIRFLCDKYAQKMTPEEIILHTLFESGTTRIYELERYIKDDVVRYGGRLAELEKKLANAYREATSEEAWDDEVLFHNVDDEEEEGQFVMGNFAESFGEDFLGLRELGIAAEFGLQSLTIPKKLLKGKGKQGLAQGPSAAKPSEPPPTFPPPPPFVPLDSTMVDHQIGLLRPFYQERLSSLSAPPSAAPRATGLHPPDVLLPPDSVIHPTAIPPSIPPSAEGEVMPLVLPDDAPSASHTKIGPLGQIMKGAPSAAAAKKKPKGKAPAAPTTIFTGPSEGDGFQGFIDASPVIVSDAQKKSKTPTSSSPKKKAGKGPDSFPPVVLASA